MKRIFNILVIISGLLLFNGCLEVNTLIKLNSDGSGTVEERVLISSEIVAMIGEFAASFGEDTTETEKFSLFEEERLREQASSFGEGVTYKSGKELIEGDKEGYIAVYSFTDINKLNIDQNPGRQIPLMEDESEGDSEDGDFLNFSFKKGSPSLLTIKMPEEKYNENEQEETEEEAIEEDSLAFQQKEEQVMRFMRDLKMTLAIDIQGDIKETNATHQNGSVITLFEINFNELLDNPEKFSEFMNKDPQSLKEVKDIIKDIPGIKVELNDPVTIKF